MYSSYEQTPELSDEQRAAIAAQFALDTDVAAAIKGELDTYIHRQPTGSFARAFYAYKHAQEMGDPHFNATSQPDGTIKPMPPIDFMAVRAIQLAQQNAERSSRAA